MLEGFNITSDGLKMDVGLFGEIMKSLQSNQNLKAIPEMSARRALTSLIFIPQKKPEQNKAPSQQDWWLETSFLVRKRKKKKNNHLLSEIQRIRQQATMLGAFQY